MSASRQYLINDLSVTESWRLFKIMAEIVDGFEQLGEISPAVSIFGSARIKPEDPLVEGYLQFDKDGRVELVEQPGGPLKVWEAPEKGTRYVHTLKRLPPAQTGLESKIVSVFIRIVQFFLRRPDCLERKAGCNDSAQQHTDCRHNDSR